jgi:hypothetical protein
VIAFLQPLALLGLMIAAVPPLLHLIGRKVPPIIPFPALRYLRETERKHSRRLRLRNLLIMLLRTLAIALIALAAGRPVARVDVGGGHAPTAVAVVLDNSLSSGAIVGGRRVLDELADRAGAVLGRASSADHLWLVLADAVPRRVTIPEATSVLDTVRPWPVYMDVSRAVRAASDAMVDDPIPAREIVLISDMQLTALGDPVEVDGRLLVWEPPPPYTDNRGLDSVWAEPPVWSPSGQVLGVIGGSATTPAAVRLLTGESDIAHAFGAPGDRIVLAGEAPEFGWHVLSVRLDPDELRADDSRELALYVAQPAAVTVTPGAGQFVVEGVRVLVDAGRAREGGDVTIGDRPTLSKTIVFPPDDPALVGAANRALESRGVPWRFGDLVEGEWAIGEGLEAAEGAAVFRRRRLEGSGTVVTRLAGEPWIVRSGEIVIVGSRLDEAWTALPVTAGFIPFLDYLVNRIAARQVSIMTPEPGRAVEAPPEAEALVLPGGPLPVGTDRRIATPLLPGVYFAIGASGDTVGAVEVNHDARESRLEPATARAISATFGTHAAMLDAAGIDRELFRGARRADLTGVFLLLALAAAVAEIAIATMTGGRGTEE